MAVRPSTSMEVSAARRGVRALIIACRGLRSEERHYRIAMAAEKSGPTSMTFPRIPAGSMSGGGQMLRAHAEIVWEGLDPAPICHRRALQIGSLGIEFDRSRD